MIALGTTRLRDFWPSERPLSLLGTWCVPEEDLWDPSARARHHVLLYPWDDRGRFDRAASHVLHVYERLLPQVAAGLNAAHGLSHSVRYWRIVVGAWLGWYLDASYDRYSCLREVLDRDSDIRTIGLDPADYMVPADTRESTGLFASDEYNLQLYTRILEGLGVSMPRKRLFHPAPPLLLARGRGVLASQSADGIRETWRRFQERLARGGPIVICGTRLSSADRLRLWSASRGRILTASRFGAFRGPSPSLSPPMREHIAASLSPRDEFEAVVARCLPADVPMSHVETYAMRRRASVGRRLPRVVVSATGWYTDEGFKILAAEAYARGAELLAIQHGGYYGMLAAMPPELHELRLSDRFYGFGWKDGLDPGVPVHAIARPEPLGVFRRSGRPPRADGPLVMVTTMHPRYLYRFESHPVGSQWEAYLERQVALAAALDPALRARLLVRLYFDDYGWNPRARWRRSFPETRFDSMSTPLERHLSSAALFVIDHPSSSLLELMAANVPLVLCWDPAYFTMRPAARDIFEDLRDAGVFHEAPDAAAACIHDVAADPARWWHGPRVQQARERFCQQYACTSLRWRDDWAVELLTRLDVVSRSIPEGGQPRTHERPVY